MAETGWTAQVAAAAGVAAGTGAAQLGLGYGLGVVEWPAGPADTSVWLGSLGWATWIAASSTVFGAVIAGRLGRTAGGPWRFALAASAAVGALLTVALIALPARSAVRTDTFSPQAIAGGYAMIGVLIGLGIAYWAVVSRPVAANLIATAAWLWLLAVAAVLSTIFWHRPSATYLSSWQFVSPDTADSQYGTISWPSAVLTLLAALVIGIIGALPAVRRGDLGVGAASSGAVGPLLVAAAFFVLAPQLTGTPGPLQSAYLIAPYAVLAGLAGSALTVSLGQRGIVRRASSSASAQDDLVDGGAVSARSRSSEPAATAAVPSPEPAASARSKAPADDSSQTAAAATSVALADGDAPRRRSFMDRFRRDRAAQGRDPSVVDPAAVATGRARAPASSTSSAPAAAAPAERTPTAGAVSARRKSSGARSAPAQTGSPQAAARSKAESRSTVAPPPSSPPVAKINEPLSGEKPPPAQKASRRPGSDSGPGPADTASSDKAPPAPETPAKSTKATPSGTPSAPRQARSTSATAPGGAWTGDSDTAELPVQDPKRRQAPRTGEDETR